MSNDIVVAPIANSKGFNIYWGEQHFYVKASDRVIHSDLLAIFYYEMETIEEKFVNGLYGLSIEEIKDDADF